MEFGIEANFQKRKMHSIEWRRRPLSGLSFSISALSIPWLSSPLSVVSDTQFQWKWHFLRNSFSFVSISKYTFRHVLGGRRADTLLSKTALDRWAVGEREQSNVWADPTVVYLQATTMRLASAKLDSQVESINHLSFRILLHIMTWQRVLTF